VQVAFSGSEPSTHAPQGQSLVYAPASRKQLRKQLEQSFKQSRKSLKKPPQFVSERSEAGALVVDQLLGELRRLELWQVGVVFKQGVPGICPATGTAGTSRQQVKLPFTAIPMLTTSNFARLCCAPCRWLRAHHVRCKGVHLHRQPHNSGNTTTHTPTNTVTSTN
jgi:hypothetical protein